MSKQFASLYDGQEVFVWSDCLPGLVTDFLVVNTVFVSDAYYLAVTSFVSMACILLWSSSVRVHDS